MRVSQFLLSTCAVLCIAWPAVSLADPPDQNQHGKEGQQKGGQPARQAQQRPQGGQAQQRPQGGQPQQRPQGARVGQAAQAGPQFQAPAQAALAHNRGQNAGQQSRTGAQGYQTRERGQYGAQAESQGAVQGSQTRNRPSGQTGAVQSGQTTSRGQYGVQNGARTAQRNQAGQTGAAARANVRGPTGPALGGWNPSVRGAQRVQAAQKWRQQNQGFDQRAVWRSNRNWWRQDPGFRLFSGVRAGFFFVPEVGYVSAPRGYWGRRWSAGEFLPRWFWRYQVRDYWRYGLPGPPPGCVWLWVNNDVALVALSDGYILDIIHNVW